MPAINHNTRRNNGSGWKFIAIVISTFVVIGAAVVAMNISNQASTSIIFEEDVDYDHRMLNNLNNGMVDIDFHTTTSNNTVSDSTP